MDAKYFGRWGCLLLYKEGGNLIYWRFVDRERFEYYCQDLTRITQFGYVIASVTSDWHGSLVAAVTYLFGDQIPHQRCLVHTQRWCESLLTQRPKTEAGVNLRELVKLLNQVKSGEEKQIWLAWLSRWEDRYGDFIKERTYGVKEDDSKTWWYTHRNLRRAFRTLKTTKDHLFLYLNHPNLPKDTNGLESEFSHLKQKINLHRGLKRRRKIAAIYWYVYLKNLERKPAQN